MATSFPSITLQGTSPYVAAFNQLMQTQGPDAAYTYLIKNYNSGFGGYGGAGSQLESALGADKAHQLVNAYSAGGTNYYPSRYNFSSLPSAMDYYRQTSTGGGRRNYTPPPSQGGGGTTTPPPMGTGSGSLPPNLSAPQGYGLSQVLGGFGIPGFENGPMYGGGSWAGTVWNPAQRGNWVSAPIPASPTNGGQAGFSAEVGGAPGINQNPWIATPYANQGAPGGNAWAATQAPIMAQQAAAQQAAAQQSALLSAPMMTAPAQTTATPGWTTPAATSLGTRKTIMGDDPAQTEGQGVVPTTLEQFKAAHPWVSGTDAEIIANLKNVIPSDFANYSPADQAFLLSIGAQGGPAQGASVPGATNTAGTATQFAIKPATPYQTTWYQSTYGGTPTGGLRSAPWANIHEQMGAALQGIAPAYPGFQWASPQALAQLGGYGLPGGWTGMLGFTPGGA